MDDVYGNYAIQSHGSETAAAHQSLTHDVNSSRGPHYNRFHRRGGHQYGGRPAAERRGESEIGSRRWRGGGGGGNSSSGRQRYMPSLDAEVSGRGGSAFQDPRLGSRTVRDGRFAATDGGEGSGVSHDELRSGYVDGNSEFEAFRSAESEIAIQQRERAQSPPAARGDRPRWAVADAPIVIGGDSMHARYLENRRPELEDVWTGEQMSDQATRLAEVVNLSTTGDGGSGGRFNGRGLDSDFAAGPHDTGNSAWQGRGKRAVDEHHRFHGEGSHNARRTGGHYRQRGGGPEGLGAPSSSSRREWCAVGVSSRADFGSDSRPDSSSGDSVTPSESRGRAFSHRGGTDENERRDHHSHPGRASKAPLASPGRGIRRNVGEGGGVYEPGVHESSDSVGALWKAKKSQVPQLVQELEDKLSRGAVECMICYDMVGRGSPVWSCASCYAIFHLSCIRKWARAPTSADLSFASSNHAASDGNWRCPGCQAVELVSAKDLRYHCFCGQVENPAVDHYLTPHSCGGPCKKTLDKSKTKRCNHYCTMQCHPGPCPPCAANAPAEYCPCGKKSVTRRCGEQDPIGSCGEVCGHVLLCGRHSCSRLCHDGPCETCKVEVRTQCFCGGKQEILSCGRVEIQGPLDFDRGLFSCANPCAKLLSCGNHRCEEKCHPGQCGECELAPSKLQTCPCGKKKIQELVASGRVRKTCVDAIPTCSQGCGKVLPCGVHVCRELCHAGICPPCKVPVNQKCRCGTTTRSVACCVSQGTMDLDGEEENGAIFLCEKKCGQKKSCGRHRCNSTCCRLYGGGPLTLHSDERERGPHDCMLTCGKMLRCKQHHCQELCHSGHCPPCLESTFTELSCACGKTSIPPPVPCGTPLPSCQQPCSFAQACGHPPTHLCHFGDCPPCAVPVSKECVGKHVILRGVPCGTRDIKCNKLCGKPRQCGLHACARACHVGPCDSPVKEDDEDHDMKQQQKLSCGQQCGAPRRDCSHTCVVACHPGSSCPDNRCRVVVSIRCGCGRMSGDVYCDAGGSNHGKVTPEVEMILSKLPAPLQPVNSNEKLPLGQRKLQCDDECGKLEKRRLLADAFGVDAKGEGGESGALGSDLLVEMLRRDPQWVLSVEERFKTLLLGPKSTGGVKVHVFCAMAKERREMIYQLAERWSLSVCSAGREPMRFPIVHVTNKSKVPYLRLLSKAQLPMAGQQIAPPFNSAVDMEPGRVVAFFDVPREVDMSRLVLRFAGECELVWLNDKNALAIFGDAARAATALRRVDHTSAYKGAISQPGSAILASGRRGGAWGQTAADVSSKPSFKKKALQQESSFWVEDAWGDEPKSSMGAWHAKGTANPITATKNPWGALDQSLVKVDNAGVGLTGRAGCFGAAASQASQHAASSEPGSSSRSNVQGERSKLPSTDTETSIETAQSMPESDPNSSWRSSAAASTGPLLSRVLDDEDDDWEKLLD